MLEKKKRQILIGAIVVSIIPALLLVRFPDLVGSKTVAIYLSALAGYVGMVVLLWSYVLGARSVMGRVFRDLAPVLSIHKWLGKYGTLAIFLHPILIVYGYGESLLYSLQLDTSSRFESHVTLGRLAFFIVAIVWVSSAVLRGRISFRPWRYVHLLGYVALPYAFLHVPDVGTQFMSSTAVKVYFFILILTFLVFTVLRLRGLFNLDKTTYKIVAHRQLVADNPSIWLLRLRPEGDRLTPAKGQYVYLKDGRISEEHPFSVLDYDDTTGDITVAYRTFGRFTRELSTRAVGTKLLLDGPYGDFTGEIRSDYGEPIVFVAGGIGVTPMVRHIVEQNPEREQWLFYANRTKNSAMMVPQLRKVLGKRLITAYSRQSEGLMPTDEQGRLCANTFRKHLQKPDAYQYFLCGSDQMMHDITAELSSLGVPSSAIHREAFGW